MVSNSSTLLINESPLQVLPSLAVALGDLEEAIILQQIQYWMNNPKSGRVGEDGRKYIRDTYKEFLLQFPWMKERTLKRKVKRLEDKKLLIVANLNKSKYDRTKWYSIDYDRLNQFVQMDSAKNAPSKVQTMHDEKCNDDTFKSAQIAPPIPKTSTKTSSETSTKNNKEESVPPKGGTTPKDEPKDKEEIPYTQIIDYLNKKTNQNLRATTKAYQRLIKARWNDGYKLEDFKTVIDNKSFEWQGTEFWKYMTPKTLFASSHFDEYLNANKRELNSNKGGGFNIDEESQKKFFEQIDDSDLPF